MEALQLSLFGVKVAVVAAPLAVSILACTKKQPKPKNMKKLKPAKAPSKRDQKSTADLLSKSKKNDSVSKKNDSVSKKAESIKEKQSDGADSNKSQSQKSVSNKEGSIKSVKNKEEEQPSNDKPEDNSAKSVSKKSTKIVGNDESSKKVEDSRKEDSRKESNKSISVKADESVKVLPNDESSKKGSGGKPKEAIAVEPQELYLNAGQKVTTKLNLENKSDSRKAIKIRCSDNGIFHITPVYTLVEPNSKATVEISRDKSKAKPDKLAIVAAEANADAKDGKEVFKASPAIDELVTVNVPVFAS